MPRTEKTRKPAKGAKKKKGMFLPSFLFMCLCITRCNDSLFRYSFRTVLDEFR